MNKYQAGFVVAVAVTLFMLIGVNQGAQFSTGLGHYLPFLILVLVPVGLGVMLFVIYKRRKDLEQLALSLNRIFEPDAASLPDLENSGLELFIQGRSRKCANLIISSGAGAEKVYFFDYSYVTGSGKARRTHHFTPACFEFSQPLFPRFELRPEGFLDKLGEMVGFADIDVPGSPEFSRQYKLTGENKDAILAFFSPRAIAFLEEHPGWRAQASGGRIVIFGRECFIPADYYLAYMQECLDLAAALAGK
jgi:hypothetical protein